MFSLQMGLIHALHSTLYSFDIINYYKVQFYFVTSRIPETNFTFCFGSNLKKMVPVDSTTLLEIKSGLLCVFLTM